MEVIGAFLSGWVGIVIIVLLVLNILLSFARSYAGKKRSQAHIKQWESSLRESEGRVQNLVKHIENNRVDLRDSIKRLYLEEEQKLRDMQDTKDAEDNG